MVFGLFEGKQKNTNGKYKRKFYSIRSVNSGRVLDVAQDGPHKGSTILWDGYGGENQQFTIIQEGPVYYIKCKKGDTFLTVEGPQNGAKFFLSAKSNNPNQQFRIDQKQGSKDHVIYTNSGKCIDCAQCGKSNGTQIVQWEHNGGKNQLWNFTDPKDVTSSSSDND